MADKVELKKQVDAAKARAHAAAKRLLNGMVNPSVVNTARFAVLERIVLSLVATVSEATHNAIIDEATRNAIIDEATRNAIIDEATRNAIIDDAVLMAMRDYWEMVAEEISS